MRAVDWDDYRYFLAVAQCGSLSAAARMLEVSQPTVGRRIDGLEGKLGLRLFDRIPSGFQISEVGTKILDRTANIHDEFVALHRQVSSEDSAIGGRVRIATAEGLGISWLAKKLPLLSERFPELEIDLSIDMTMADLLRGEA
ncbi:MAG: LysR family transcriptional regulator, partial [Gammaproteobacteria bacterium]|nr:LysR family transcriptional regulator [Gammaproteobacteria bacterium]